MILKRKWMVLLLGFLFCLSVQHAAGAAELKGKVTAVNGTTVQIQLDGDQLPRVGDPVNIGFKVPGLGLVPLEGKWRVSFAGPAAVEAEPAGTAPQPQVGQLVSIQSAQPDDVPPNAGADAAETAYERGEDYFHGRNGMARDYGRALAAYREAADLGYAKAQNKIGQMYKEGQGVPGDPVEAVKWYRRAATQGYAKARHNMGNAYYNGEGVGQDYGQALAWYRKAADQGVPESQNQMGVMYSRGRGVTVDYAEGARWYRMAADAGHPSAQSNLAFKYIDGKGVPRNYEQAAAWCLKGAAQGKAACAVKLGVAHERGLNGLAVDYAAALKWYRLAAEKGHHAGQFNMGIMYLKGRGVPKDPKMVVHWYRKAADQGYAKAQYFLGTKYEKGVGVARDLDEAVRWYRLAAKQGWNDAKKALARLGRQ